ncbi:MAG: hypothetical protein R3Y43_06025 [Alphaproteobacteria bacterium]
MIKFLKETESFFKALDAEYQTARNQGGLISFTPTAFISFLIIRLSCEYEASLHKIVLKKLQKETKSKHLHSYFEKNIKLRSSKRNNIKDNLKNINLCINNMNAIFENEKEQIFYDKIFGTKKDEEGANNIRNQIAHSLDFDFTQLPQWSELFEYIEICDNVLQRIEAEMIFL